MEKPTPKTEAAVKLVIPESRHIIMDASPDAAEDFRVFGNINRVGTTYWLFVDTRYSFDEVLAYIEQYGEG
jgi:3'-phosphoadenosine 5'-phosphosulfate sulfotransferase (PAPS reductase)/FAD synthetase